MRHAVSAAALNTTTRRALQRKAKRQSFEDLPPAPEGYTVSVTLPEPPSANRWWRRAGTHMHLSTAARDYKDRVAALGGFTHRFVDGPICVTVAWYRGRKAGDLDKRLGVLLDALQGVAYTTDAQITELHATRHDDKTNPRVEITVTFAHG